MNIKWQKRFMLMSQMIAEWSKDPSSKVGCVIVSPERQILSTGYNGFPSNIPDDPELLNDRAKKYPLIIHAELNAILNAAKNGVNIKDAWLFATTLPICENCAKHVAQAGISTVVIQKDYSPLIRERWKDSIAQAEYTFNLAKIPIIKI